MSCKGTMPLSERSRSHLQFQCLCACFCFWTVISLCIEDFKIISQKFLAYQDDMLWERTTPLSQRSRSHRQFKCKNASIHVLSVILLCMEGFSFGTSVCHIKTTCHAIEQWPYLKGQGHTCYFSVCMLVFVSGLLYTQDDVSWERTSALSQWSRSNFQFQHLYACFFVQTVFALMHKRVLK